VLVAVGAAMFCLIAAMSPHEASPTRIAAQIASGIGFLGAGVILRDGLNIRGLNTAATLWCAAAAGAIAGSGFPLPAVAASLMILGTNLFLRQLTSTFEAFQDTRLRREVRYEVHVLCEGHGRQHVRALVRTTIRESALVLVSFRSAMLDAGQQCQIVTVLATAERFNQEVEDLIARLSTEDGVVSAAWQCTADPSQKSDAPRLTLVGYDGASRASGAGRDRALRVAGSDRRPAADDVHASPGKESAECL
jgi:putative Mg2+ transporter-C (MgtC) family protein